MAKTAKHAARRWDVAMRRECYLIGNTTMHLRIETAQKNDAPIMLRLIAALAEYEPVGLAIWFHNYSTFLARKGLYLEDLFVLPEWRGQGIGTALLVHLAGVAVERGCGRMEWSVLDWNAPAIGFYRSLGATPMDEWTVFRLTGDALTALAHRG